MRRLVWPPAFALLAFGAAGAADRQIAVDPQVAISWGFTTGGPTVQTKADRGVSAGFWQRGSGAKPGVGMNVTGTIEFQLPENPPTRIRSATLQLTGRASQCAGDEPVVFDVYGYAGDGKADVADATAGTTLARMTAGCKDNPAFAQPIDVSDLVRRLSVASGIRHAGFNVRKANNRALPSLFAFGAIQLTIVVAEEGTGTAGAPAPAPPGAGNAMMAKYAGSYDVDGLLREPSVRARLQDLLGPELKHLEANLNVAGSIDVTGGALSVSGNAPHAGGEEEAVVCVAPNGPVVQAAIGSKGSITAYAAGGDYDSLLLCVKDWITQFRSGHVDRMQQPKNVRVVKGP